MIRPQYPKSAFVKLRSQTWWFRYTFFNGSHGPYGSPTSNAVGLLRYTRIVPLKPFPSKDEPRL